MLDADDSLRERKCPTANRQLDDARLGSDRLRREPEDRPGQQDDALSAAQGATWKVKSPSVTWVSTDRTRQTTR